MGRGDDRGLCEALSEIWGHPIFTFGTSRLSAINMKYGHSSLFDMTVPDSNPHIPPTARRDMSNEQEAEEEFDRMFAREAVVSNSIRARAIYDALTIRWHKKAENMI